MAFSRWSFFQESRVTFPRNDLTSLWADVNYDQMRLTINPLTSVEQTGKVMGRLAVDYCLDAAPLASLNMVELHELIRGWPYIADPKGTEWCQRPKFTIEGTGPFRDCDDRAIVVGAWAELHEYPFQFVAAGYGKRPHHVFCEVLVGDEWFTMDATYPTDRPNLPKVWGFRKVIFSRSRT